MLTVIFQVLSCLALNISDYTLQVQIRYHFTMDNLLVGQFAGCFVAALNLYYCFKYFFSVQKLLNY